jgi:hypothetical protein
MSEGARGLDDDRLKRLVRDLEPIVRRELPWYDGTQHDPSVALIELLAFLGDAVTEYQLRAAGEAHLETRPRLLVMVDSSTWLEVGSLESSGPGDRVYVVDRGANGSATVRFGDGQHGKTPPAGARVHGTYGTGASGDRAAVTIRWPPVPPLALEIHAGPRHLRFAPPRRSWRDCLARLLGGGR